ncbi:hypothetical protein HPB51_011204 [Rhipicephalus microplus]|uniref:Protein kinase domain-containing protein n=1 Tax=Rhipicephalus microplus TaxID=6941 RepID=A0A9J6F214_RHIMP|nr:hypothetical protein HPB51_011204 [Rhipicephalus microplus]
METVGEFEYNTKDLIGHGAFAVVYKGRYKTARVRSSSTIRDILSRKRVPVSSAVERRFTAADAAKGARELSLEEDYSLEKIG